MNNMIIRQSRDEDLDSIMAIYERAFGKKNEALLTKEILSDAGAEPSLSLIAIVDGNPVGHIVFTKGNIDGADESTNAWILAQTAVVPESQGLGIGDDLTLNGLRHLAEQNADVVFVFGHPVYYPRFGFQPASTFDLGAPYPIPDKHRYSWMVRELNLGAMRDLHGQVKCAGGLNISEYWGK
ncbi:MAG: N-acetyltransferase [bacterium]|nr:N-acetyltransferase [bacterium]